MCLIVFLIMILYHVSPSKFQVVSPLMLWIPLGSSCKGVDDAGSDHRSEGLCVLDHITMMLFLSISVDFNLLMPNSSFFESFWNMEVFISQHFDRLRGTFSFGWRGRWVSRCSCGSGALEIRCNCFWQGLFIAFDLLFLTVFCSMWVIKIALAHLILPQWISRQETFATCKTPHQVFVLRHSPC